MAEPFPDLPTLVSWPAAGPDGGRRDCGSGGYQRSQVLWEPPGRRVRGPREPKERPSWASRQEEDAGAKAGRDPQTKDPPGAKAQRWEPVKVVVRAAECLVGEEGQRKTGTAGLEVRGLECHTEKCGQRRDASGDGVYRRPERNEQECGRRKRETPGKIREREERRQGRGEGGGREGRWEPIGSESFLRTGAQQWGGVRPGQGAFGLTLGPCHTEPPAQSQQGDRE